MFSYILRRLFYAIPIALGVTVVCFSLVHIGPGDPLTALLGENATQEVIDQIKAAYGLDKPLPVQYAIWLGKAVVGDLGNSIITRREVLTELGPAIMNSLLLAIGGSIVGFTVGLVLGSIAGYLHGRPADRLVTGIAITGVSIPHYWLAIVLVIIFSVELGWLPSMGMGPGGSGEFALDWAHLQHVVLPVIALSVIPAGIVTRTVRGNVAELLNQQFVEALRSKGLTESKVFRHVAKNAAPQVLAVMGLQLGYLLGGSILIETVFQWPGTGLLLNNSIFQRDIPVLQGTILVLALFFVSVNLLVDIAQAMLDPRIKR